MALRLSKSGNNLTEVSEKEYQIRRCGEHVADAAHPIRLQRDGTWRQIMTCLKCRFAIDENPAVL